MTFGMTTETDSKLWELNEMTYCSIRKKLVNSLDEFSDGLAAPIGWIVFQVGAKIWVEA